MTHSQIIELICQIVQDLMAKMSITGQVKAKIVDKDNQEVIWVNVETHEPARLLIGQKGSNLAALQHVVRLMVRRQVKENMNFVIDVNQYKESRAQYLRKLAQSSAARVAQSKEPLVLDIMPAYERRVIHLALADSVEVTTESTGEEGERRVVINPR